MSDESADRSVGTPDGRGYPQRGAGQQSPLQARAQFLKNRSWELVIRLNRGACERGGAQHGFNSETQAATAQEWEAKRQTTLSLDETLEFLRYCHRRAPFLFYNGSTFADIARQIGAAVLADLPPARLREATSALAHYVAGVLDRNSMAGTLAELWTCSNLKPGDRVKTLRGSTHGIILRVLEDGRVVWQPSGSSAELTALPESLLSVR